jgi:hypothetical protein
MEILAVSQAGKRFRGEALQDRELKKWRGKFAYRLKMVKVEVLRESSSRAKAISLFFLAFLVAQDFGHAQAAFFYSRVQHGFYLIVPLQEF